MEIPGGGGVSRVGGGREGEGARGREGICGDFWGGGGAKYFFSGRNVHQGCYVFVGLDGCRGDWRDLWPSKHGDKGKLVQV